MGHKFFKAKNFKAKGRKDWKESANTEVSELINEKEENLIEDTFPIWWDFYPTIEDVFEEQNSDFLFVTQ